LSIMNGKLRPHQGLSSVEGTITEEVVSSISRFTYLQIKVTLGICWKAIATGKSQATRYPFKRAIVGENASSRIWHSC